MFSGGAVHLYHNGPEKRDKFSINNINIIQAKLHQMVGRDSPVGIATSYGLDGPGTDPVSCTMGTGSLLGVKRPRHGVNYPPHLVPMFKKE